MIHQIINNTNILANKNNILNLRQSMYRDTIINKVYNLRSLGFSIASISKQLNLSPTYIARTIDLLSKSSNLPPIEITTRKDRLTIG